MNRILMCPPDHFHVLYEINPWMSLRRKVDEAKAQKQWRDYYDLLTKSLGIQVELLDPVKGLPDLVFTANAGLVKPLTRALSPWGRGENEIAKSSSNISSPLGRGQGEGKKLFIRSNFRHPERAKEEPYYEQWFKKKGYAIKTLERPLCFEGEGDALFMGKELYTGYHFRSDVESHDAVSGYLKNDYFALELKDKRFYHLDTCFAPLNETAALIYLDAFETYAQLALLENIKDPIRVPEDEALKFACNAFIAGTDAVIPEHCPQVKRELGGRGFQVYELDFSEFIKAGGAGKCLVLWLEKK